MPGLRPGPVWCVGLAGLLAAAAWPGPVRAQQDTTRTAIRGVVLDQASGQPIEDASVRLLGPAGETLGLAVSTDQAGRFVVEAPGAGVYRVHGERVGYHAGETPPLTLKAGETLATELRLAPTPFLLDTVQVNVARAAHPPRTGEQLIKGELIDADTRTPIPYGTVRLLWQGRSPVVTVLTAHDGTFRMVSPEAGTYKLRAAAMGYKAADSHDLYLLPGDTIDVTFRLGADAVVLDPLTVNVSARPWGNRREMVGMRPFFERYAKFGGSGYSKIMTRDSLRRWQGKVQNTGQMLQWATPLVRLADPITGAMTLRGSCTPTYYLNGTLVPYEDVQSMSPVLLEGVEVYLRPAIPAALGRGDPCGVVSFWSRQSPPDKLPPNKIGRKLAIFVVIVGILWLVIKVH